MHACVMQRITANTSYPDKYYANRNEYTDNLISQQLYDHIGEDASNRINSTGPS